MHTRITRLLSAVFLAGTLVFGCHLLYSAICAFSAQNYLMSDYGVYTNTIYNLAHGNGFKFMFEHSYLKTHLSFSFILLVPLFWLFRTPLLLIFVQWAFLLGGTMIMYRIMRRLKVSMLLTSMVLFFVSAFYMTQSVMLSEFHGVSAYYILLPWLLHELLFRRRLSVIPLLCIAGLREDGGLVALPMLVFFAATGKWRSGYWLAGASLAYTVLAVCLLYPLINGVSIFEIRAGEASAAGISSAMNSAAFIERARPLLWLAAVSLILVCIAGKGAAPVFIFPSVALLKAMLSGMSRQHSLAFHYPAPVIAAMACGMTLAVCSAGKNQSVRTSLSAAAMLILMTVSHYLNGFFLGSRTDHGVYSSIDARIYPLHELSQEVQKEGMLAANRKLAPYFAMREDIMIWHYFDSESHVPDVAVCDIHELESGKLEWLRAALEKGEYGVTRIHQPYLVLQRGAPATATFLDTPILYPSIMPSHGGSSVFDRKAGLLKYWDGTARRAPVTLAYGMPVKLAAGSYTAVFSIRLLPDAEPEDKGFGQISIHRIHQADSITCVNLAPPFNGEFQDYKLSFSLNTETTIEPRITGGGAELWALSIRILEDQPDNDPSGNDS